MNIIILVLKFSSQNLLYLLYLCQCEIDPANTYSYSSTLWAKRDIGSDETMGNS